MSNFLQRVFAFAALLFSVTGAVSHAAVQCEPGYLCTCTSPIIIHFGGQGIKLTDAAH